MALKLHVCPGQSLFVLPYIAREFPGKNDLTDDIASADIAVMLSSSEIYEPSPEAWLDEDSSLVADSELRRREDEFMQRASDASVKAIVLRCAPIAGTAMSGRIMLLAADIHRGFFFHLPGNEARTSVVHASDIARAIRFMVDNDVQAGIYNITDGDDPSIHDLAEALAFRMKNKRISTLSTKPQQIIGRILYGKERLRRYTQSHLISSSRLQALGFEPQAVCNYLRTHVYDENSL